MNIDLFLTAQSEAALVCDGSFKTLLAGVILDAQTREMTLEFGDGSTLHMNIPIEDTHKEKVLFAHRITAGFFENGLLSDSYEVPLLYLNDPYGSAFGDKSPLAKPVRSVLAFEQFLKRCKFAQGLHRDNLGDEDKARPVLAGIDLNKITFTPALLRQMQLGTAPKTTVAAQVPAPGGSVATTQTRPATKQGDDEGEKK